MIISSKLNAEDNIDWQITYCESGSSLTIITSGQNVLLSITCIPPAKLELLRDRINEELAKPILIDPITKRRRETKEMPVHLEGL